MKPSLILPIFLAIILALTLDWGFIQYLRRRKKNAPPAAPAEPDRTRALLRWIDFLAGVGLVIAGQVWLAKEGHVSYPVSDWLNRTFFFDIPNLDQVLIGLPLLIGGCLLLVRALRIADLQALEQIPGTLSRLAFPWGGLRGLWIPALGGGAAFLFLLWRLAILQYQHFLAWLWAAVLILFAVLAWRWDRREGVRLSPNLGRADALWMTGLTLVGLLAVSFRLQAVPGLLIGDEGNFWTTARDIALGAYQPPIFDYGVYTYAVFSSLLQGLALRLFGITLWGWRFSSVLAGVAAIPPLYLLAREMFDRRVAVAACVALIGAPYFLAFARLGYNNIQTLFIVTLAFAWFYQGFKRGSALYLYLAGCAAGFGYYTYTAARSAILILALFLLAYFVTQRAKRGAAFRAALVLGLGCFLVAAPHLFYGLALNPTSFRTKLLESVFFNAGYADQFFHDSALYARAFFWQVDESRLFFEPLLYGVLILRGLARSLVAFHQVFLVNEHFLFSPLAGPWAVIFYTGGLALAFSRLKQRRYAFLLLWVGFTWLTLSATNTYPPRHQHMVGMIPAMALLIGLGTVRLVEALASLWPRLARARAAQTGLLGLLLALIAASGWYNYFVTMPTRYWPDFEQTISWAALYSPGDNFVYLYPASDPIGAEFKPYVLREMRRDVPYQAIPLDGVRSGAVSGSLPAGSLVFFRPADEAAVRELILPGWSGPAVFSLYTNREGQPIGEMLAGVSLAAVTAPADLAGMLLDSYNHAGLIVLLAGLVALLGLTALSPLLLRRAPGWLKSAAAWLAQPPAAVEAEPDTPEETRAAPPEPQPVPQLPPLDLPDESPAAPEAPPAVRRLVELELRLKINWPEWLGARAPWQVQLTNLRPARPRPVKVTAPRPVEPVKPAAALQNGPTRSLAFILAGLGVLVGVYAQTLLLGERNLSPGIWYLLAGGVLIAAAILLWPGRAANPTVPPVDSPVAWWIAERGLRVRLGILAAALCGVTLGVYQGRAGAEGHWDIFALWLAGILLYLAAFLPPLHFSGVPHWLKTHWRQLLPFLLVLAVAAGLRFYRLGAVPNIMENDEGIVGTQILRVLNGEQKNMFEVFGGYGTLHFFLLSLMVRWFGQTFFAIRVMTALVGTLTIPVVAWAAWRMFDRRVALVAAALMAVSHIHIHFSRVSPTASSIDPLFCTLLVGLLYRALTTRRAYLWAAAGLVMGLGFYFYVGARVLVLIGLGLPLALLIFDRGLLRRNLGGLAVMLGAFFVTAGPMLLWASQNLDSFNNRVNQVGILQNGWLVAEMASQGKPAWEILWQQLVKALLIFNYSNAQWFYDARMPMLGFITGLLAVAGLLNSLPRLRNLSFLALNVWFWGTLGSGQVMAVDPAPNAYRTLGLLPAVCILAAAALIALGRLVFTSGGRHWPRLASAALSLVLLFELGWNVNYYFVTWANGNFYGDAESRRASLIGEYLGGLPQGYQAYIAGAPDFRGKGWSALEYLRGQTPYQDVEGAAVDALRAADTGQPLVIIFTPLHSDELEEVQRQFPGGRVVERTLGGETYYLAYELPGVK